MRSSLMSVLLNWHGPCQNSDLPEKPGLYAWVSSRYGDPRMVLSYIGKAENQTLPVRWQQEERYLNWVARHRAIFSCELHYASPEPVLYGLIDNIETVLIWIHSPPMNAKKLSMAPPIHLRQHFSLTNTGSLCGYLMSTIDTTLKWYGFSDHPFVVPDAPDL